MELGLSVAIVAAKLTEHICRRIGTRASSLPGKVARLVCPDFITRMAKKVRGEIIVTCGTNGKTTTNNLMYTCLTKAGRKCVCNTIGANMLNGIATAFVRSASVWGTLDADCACFEVDEAYLHQAFGEFTPDLIVVTNLFVDQLDRYGEVDATEKLLLKAFDLAPNATYILNADDPVTSMFGQGKNAVYYGIGEALTLRRPAEKTSEVYCTLCGGKLRYDHVCYDKIGQYRCEGCGYANPRAEVVAEGITLSEGQLGFAIGQRRITTPITGVYNIYNILMAATAMRSVGVDDAVCDAVFNAQKPEPGRMSQFALHNKTAYLILSKNPTGFNQSVMTVLNDARKKDVLLAINDAAGDGEDVCWIWDVDLESLVSASDGRIVLCGTRAYDVYLRLQYADMDMQRVSVYADYDSAALALAEGGAAVAYALVNYTAMYPMYKALEKLQEGDK